MHNKKNAMKIQNLNTPMLSGYTITILLELFVLTAHRALLANYRKGLWIFNQFDCFLFK